MACLPWRSGQSENTAPQRCTTTLGLRLRKLAKHRPSAAQTIQTQNALPLHKVCGKTARRNRAGLVQRSIRSRLRATYPYSLASMCSSSRIAVLAALLALTGCAPCLRGVKDVVSSSNHGHGFCSATLMRPSSSDFESIGYFGHCFYRSRDLGSCSGLSVSPSGRVAAWQDGPSGGIRAFSPAWLEPRWLVPEFKGLVSQITWGETSGEAHISFQGGVSPLTARIPDGG
jgi:hypothetical protein